MEERGWVLEWGWHGSWGAAGSCQGEESEGVNVAQAREMLISHSLGMLRCLPGLLSPWPSCSTRVHRGAAVGTVEPPSLRGPFPEAKLVATLLDALYPQSCKSAAACAALPPSPETSGVPGTSLSPQLIFRGGWEASPWCHQPLEGLWVHISLCQPTVVWKLSLRGPQPSEMVATVFGCFKETARATRGAASVGSSGWRQSPAC